VAISVSDDGRGIPPEHLERIFDRLYQVGDAARQRDSADGLGLGLAIARSIVEAHGGQITVRSQVGRGTRFRFSLPAAPGSRPATEARGITTPAG
jgi:signal transduction histidine kinase